MEHLTCVSLLVMENENQKARSGCIISFTFWLIWKSLGITSLSEVLRQSVFRCVNEFTIKIFNRAVSFNWLWLINVVSRGFLGFFKMAVDRRLTTILRNTQKAPGKSLMANISWLYSQSEEDSAVFNGVSYRTLVNLVSRVFSGIFPKYPEDLEDKVDHWPIFS